MRHPDYAIFSFLAMFAVSLPLPWHWKARNIATLSIIFWLLLANLVIFVNGIVWAGNYVDRSPVWCDISGRITLAAGIAIPICCLSQMQRLEAVASTRKAGVSTSTNRRRMALDVSFCFGLPIVQVILRYIVQGHRYDIHENIGCSIPALFSWPTVVITYFVPLIVAIAAAVYAVLALRWFLIRRMQFLAVLQASPGGLTTGRYLRLISLAMVDVTLVIFGTLFTMISSFKNLDLMAYGSWQSAHQDFSQVLQFPEDIHDNVTTAVPLYLFPIYSFSFFIFFGFGEEAIHEYIRIGRMLVSWCQSLDFRQQSTVNAIPRTDFTLGSKAMRVRTFGGRSENVDRDGLRFHDKDRQLPDDTADNSKLNISLSTEVTIV